MKAFFSAMSFLTILPVPARLCQDQAELGRGTIFFPAIGLIIGLATAGTVYIIHIVLPGQLAALIAVGMLVAFSGALHLDGLADTCDGFLSSRPREQVLDIMRDSRVGTMAVAGIVWLILLKWVTLSHVPSPQRWVALILMPLTGRTALLIMMTLLPYARAEGGLVSAFAGHEWLKRFGIAIGVALMLLLSCVGFGRYGVIITVVSLGGILLFCYWSYDKIGGYTGDTLGAVCEVSEAFPTLVGVIVSYSGGNGL
ncbi:MAG: adenosylcobinamide-GDP ribazoletransferase [Deltaproteobacteria bacterium]|nr:MAG: adenosylcobinamide-GDP ribazoletransferase [Deltaproteobacteria bacterium]RLB85855.1 MAG: adenosylcobinamide-GDP ribazoletransferase [Deltaproteobacteria bacterium]